MGYKVFQISKLHKNSQRTGTDGYQPKFISSDGKYFIKAQCNLGGYLVDDWKVEVIASKLCNLFNFRCIEQLPCYLVDKDLKLHGVYSRNLLLHTFKSFESLLEANRLSTKDPWFVKADAISKIYSLAEAVQKSMCASYNIQVDKKDIVDYIVKCAIIDILVCNNDRHTRNYSIIFDKYGKLIPLTIYDCGMGLFENDIYLRGLNTYQECLRYSYIAPYGEDPFDLIEYLDREFKIRDYLRKMQKPNISHTLFPTKKSYEYFKEVCKQIW